MIEIFKQVFFTNTIFFSVFVFIIGACIASFFNVVIFRLPKMIDHENASDIKSWLEEKNIKSPHELEDIIKEKINIAFPSSHCFNCKKPIKWYYNIPIIGFFLTKCQCSECKEKISIQYPIIELIGGILFVFSYLFFMKFGIETFIIGSTLFFTLVLLFFIDLKTMFLPDNITLPLLWGGILLSTINHGLFNIQINDSILGVILGYLILFIIAKGGKIILKKDAMGEGDFKLLAAIGSFLGIKGVFITFLMSPFLGILTWLILKMVKKEEKQIPFGPSIILSSVIAIIYKTQILSFLSIM